ncbi:Protein S100-P [Collichthys lucidus]|uniref:Protein S100 n=1 Tax=Collichthys lucidus TaxID=240159 RepID=A0A4U5VYF3_COLLU|nr:Protein S100-P [Collichthys lucidus]
MSDMNQLETAMVLLMQTFDKYAAGQGNRDALTQAEAKTLLEKELPGLIKASKNPEKVEEMLKSLDLNGDKEIDFSEFMVLVNCVACNFREVLMN